MPIKEYGVSNYDAVLAFNKFVFIFFFKFRQIFVWDIKRNTWYTSDTVLPFVGHGHSKIYTYLQNYIIHILRFPEADHFTVNIYDLIPQKMKKDYDEISKKLVSGYCRQQTYHLPFVLIFLIALFYPSFI